MIGSKPRSLVEETLNTQRVIRRMFRTPWSAPTPGSPGSTIDAARQVLVSLPRQQPMGMCIGDFDEAKDRMSRDRASAFVVVPRPEGEVQGLRQQRPTMLAVQLLADL